MVLFFTIFLSFFLVMKLPVRVREKSLFASYVFSFICLNQPMILSGSFSVFLPPMEYYAPGVVPFRSTIYCSCIFTRCPFPSPSIPLRFKLTTPYPPRSVSFSVLLHTPVSKGHVLSDVWIPFIPFLWFPPPWKFSLVGLCPQGLQLSW